MDAKSPRFQNAQKETMAEYGCRTTMQTVAFVAQSLFPSLSFAKGLRNSVLLSLLLGQMSLMFDNEENSETFLLKIRGFVLPRHAQQYIPTTMPLT